MRPIKIYGVLNLNAFDEGIALRREGKTGLYVLYLLRFPEIPRRHAIELPEAAAHLYDIAKTAGCGNDFVGRIGGAEPFADDFGSEVCAIVLEREAGRSFYLFRQVLKGNLKFPGNLGAFYIGLQDEKVDNLPEASELLLFSI